MNTMQIHYMCSPDRPSSGVHFVVMRESAVNCIAVLRFLCSCIGLIVRYVVYHDVAMHIFGL
jgi:hypothetical protein